ncbi:hypothetical protein CVIRNUC_001095 [Coccomyxa viridis]|uniref:Hexosyltransferase n=1 Tax=Coccomyxa viridis TaxID=1274662 RepID=A0AAV1HWJ0_9CHLO|nr:hypothetical protein CVIRNUC_001095 [Coccomyxa viridis]
MLSLAAHSAKASSLAAALLLTTGLFIHLHLLRSSNLPSIVSSNELLLSPGGSSLPSDSTAALAHAHSAHRVEFSIAGLFLDLEDALNIDLPLQRAEAQVEALFLQGSSAHKDDSSDARNAWKRPQQGAAGRRFGVFGGSQHQAEDEAAGAELRVLIAVTSECCSSTSKSALRRAEARQTWAKHIREKHLGADIRFVLAQPPANSRAAAVAELRHEAADSRDLLVIRGREEYKNLPNKSVRLLRYALSSPSGYTHVLKTDDDCYIRYPALAATLRQPETAEPDGGTTQVQMRGVYKGCLENPHGFFALRNPDSKWHIPYEDMPDSVVPWERKYLAGWGYLLSRDVAQHVVNATSAWNRAPDKAPGWYAGLHWEDVLIGLIASGVTGEEPQDDPAFVAAWKGCSAATAVRHLDVEAPQLFWPLYQMELRGAWRGDQVNCSEGEYAIDDYWSWKGWRDSLAGVQALGTVGRRLD